MAYTTNVPQLTWAPTGFQAQPESALQAGAAADINAAFGATLNPSAATPQGQMANSLAAIIGNLQNILLLYFNLVDPALSSGRMQDAIARIYYLSRIGASPTVVSCTCTGSGCTIPIGALAQDQAGNVYSCSQQGTIAINGAPITLPFENIVPGPTPCPAGTLTIIAQQINGWDAITNASAGVTGIAEETPQAFEARRFASVAANAIGSLPSIRGAVLSLPGVVDCYTTENNTSSPMTIGGVSVLENSLYVAVVGGVASAIAYAIWTHKSPGSLYNGSTSYTVYDTQFGYSPPYPAYTISWVTPTTLPFVVAVTMANNGFVPANATTLVQTAIVGAFSGADGGPQVGIGLTVYAQRFAAAGVFRNAFYATLANLWPNAQVVSIAIGSTNAPGAQFSASIGATNMTVTAVASGTIAVGQNVLDLTGLVLPGTIIQSQTSGTTGGIGVYVINFSQSVSSETMYGVTATLAEATVNINQYPGIAALNVSLTLV